MREKEESLVQEAASGKSDESTTSISESTLDVLARQQRASNIPSIVSCSGKMVLLDKLLPKLQSEGHRVLIFSQVSNKNNCISGYIGYIGLLLRIVTETIPSLSKGNWF